MSAARGGSGEAGFTLVEMLVVLALLALVAAGSAFAFAGQRPARVLAATADQLAADLQRTRLDAMRSGRMRHLVFEAGTRRWQREGATPVPLPDGLTLDLMTASEARASGAAGDGVAIAFLPDGRSTGGRITLRLGAGRQGIEVNWLTGAIGRSAP